MRFHCCQYLLVASVLTFVNADFDQCLDDLYVVIENEKVSKSTQEFFAEYLEYCLSLTDNCPFEAGEELSALLGLAAIGSELDPITTIPPIDFTTDISMSDFLASTTTTFPDYMTACTAEGAEIQCVDVKVNVEGPGNAEGDEPETNVSVDVAGVPLCLPSSCDNEDLVTVVTKLLQNEAENDATVAIMIPGGTSMLSPDTVCQFYDTCTFKVDRVACPVVSEPGEVSADGASNEANADGASSEANTVGPVIAFLVSIAAACTLLY